MKKLILSLLIGITIMGAGCKSSSSLHSCTRPQNPYNPSSGHYAGWEWGESGKSCGGNSNSFIEGCEDYQEQMDDYEECV
jgi:hypothetical protein